MELIFVQDELNFDEKFEALGEYYRMDSPLEIRSQIEMGILGWFH